MKLSKMLRNLKCNNSMGLLINSRTLGFLTVSQYSEKMFGFFGVPAYYQPTFMGLKIGEEARKTE